MEAGATLTTALGVTAAVLSPDPVWGAPSTDAGPDAALIAACDRCIWTLNTVEAAPSDAEAGDHPLWCEMEAAEKAAQAIPACTLAGVAAKARVAVAIGTGADGTVRLGDSHAGDWPEIVVRDVLRIVGIEVPA